jgi:hypothetical protein
MKKVALLGLLSVAVMANESGLYVGGEVGRTHQKDVESGVNVSNDSTSYQINGGYYINQNNRAYAFYSYISKGDYYTHTDAYGAGYDYLIGTSPLKPFVGAIVAYSDFSYPGFKMTGMAYGGQMGIDYSVNGNLSVDAGYKYLLSDAKEGSTEAKSFSAFFAGANYKF